MTVTAFREKGGGYGATGQAIDGNVEAVEFLLRSGRDGIGFFKHGTFYEHSIFKY